MNAAVEPASSAAIPNVVDDRDLAAANSLVGSAWGTMLAVGAALGGLVVTLFGRDAAILGNSFSFLVSAWLLWRVHRAFSEQRDEHVEHPRVLEATRETAAYARQDHRVLALLGVKAGFGLAAGVLVLIAVFATDVFHEGDIGIGLLMASRGVGALIGPFLGRSIAGADDRRLYTAIGLALAVFGTSYMLFGLSPSLLVAAPIVLCAHLGGGAQWTLSTYGLQRLTPDRQAREAMWQRFIPAAVVDNVDVEQLVDRTKGFSPADIEFAARSASQRALEKAVYDDGGLASGGGVSVREAVRKGPATQDYLDAIADTRTTVSDEVHQEFLEDIDALGRV